MLVQRRAAFALVALTAVVMTNAVCSSRWANRRYVFPVGFRGTYRIVRDLSVRSALPEEGGATLLRFPRSGILRVGAEDFTSLSGWAQDEHLFEDGTRIARKEAAYRLPKGTACYVGLGYSSSSKGGVLEYEEYRGEIIDAP